MAHAEREEERLLHLEEEVRTLCQQIEQLAAQIPDERDRAYAGVAQECLWTMYQRACERVAARHAAQKNASDGSAPAGRNECTCWPGGNSLSSAESGEVSR
jgi:hypothetical protein